MDPLFGSETRARVLDQLAISPRPLSAYRIAKSIGAEPIQVLRILRRLEGYTEFTANGWRMADDGLRRFLRARRDQRDEKIRHEKDELLRKFGLRGRERRGGSRAR